MDVEGTECIDVGGRGTGGRFSLLFMLCNESVGIGGSGGGVVVRGTEAELLREEVEVIISEEVVEVVVVVAGSDVIDAFLLRYSSIIRSLSSSSSAIRFLSSDISMAAKAGSE